MELSGFTRGIKSGRERLRQMKMAVLAAVGTTLMSGKRDLINICRKKVIKSKIGIEKQTYVWYTESMITFKNKSLDLLLGKKRC